MRPQLKHVQTKLLSQVTKVYFSWVSGWEPSRLGGFKDAKLVNSKHSRRASISSPSGVVPNKIKPLVETKHSDLPYFLGTNHSKNDGKHRRISQFP